MFRSICSTILLLLTAAPAPPEIGWQEMLTAAIRRATTQNPRVREAEFRIEAARRRVPQATALPDPEVEIGLKDAPVRNPSLSRDDFTMEMVTGRQRLPARGKRSAQLAMAQTGVEGAAAMRAREVVEIAADTADAFFQMAATDRSLAILEESRQRLEDAAASATERYKVGKAGQSDVLQASLEKTSLEEQLSSLRAERRAQAARFNALQGLPAGAPVPRIGSLPSDFEIPNTTELARRAAESSPAVAAAAAEVHRAEQELELARLEGRPDWTLMSYYGHRERFEDLVGVSASISLPWAHRGRLDERRAEKEADLAAARARVEIARNQIQGDIETAYADLQKNVEQSRLYTSSILPQADINYRAAREAYVVGKIDFLTLVRAATSLDRYRQEAAMRTSGIGRALAALQKASGLPLLPGTPGAGDSHDEN
ncbi:MAG TPA: TolC family protein [Thermoanaerobaculia bacterium]|jgi:outer membrane protein TolC|nr:TolC family protein [Thermoanaerobaculia bacterium]